MLKQKEEGRTVKKKTVSEYYGKKEKQEPFCQACVWFDRYEIKEILGEGGTGRVYLARDMRLERLVAIKILEQVTGQFQEEVAVLREQNFGMLPTIYDAWTEENKTGVIVMEYVRGQNLKEYLALHKQIAEKQVYNWGVQLGEFLDKLHSRNPKILYRDLKLENIMVQPDKTLRLVDVGAAVRLDGASLYEKKRVGTLGYAAPEQWEGKAVDERADLYSLGAVLYAISEGEEKLKNRVETKLLAESGNVPWGMMQVIGRCLRRDRSGRYVSAKAFLADWKRYQREGRVKSVIEGAGVVLKYAFLYAAVNIIWYKCKLSFYITADGGVAEFLRDMQDGREAHLPLLWRFLFGYLLLKAAEWVWRRRNEKWEQKKSVWCRGGEYDKIYTKTAGFSSRHCDHD